MNNVMKYQAKIIFSRDKFIDMLPILKSIIEAGIVKIIDNPKFLNLKYISNVPKESGDITISLDFYSVLKYS